MKIIAVSDTHESFHVPEDMPEGDVLVHAGDITNMGYKHAIKQFAEWLKSIEHKYDEIVVIAGNHDFLFEENPMEAQGILREYGPHNLHYLQDESFVYHHLESDKEYKFYGSPWTPRFHDWAFNVNRGVLIAAKWQMIPGDTDVLITHGPPHGILDPGRGEEHVGCEELLKWMPSGVKAHIFGHCHGGYGRVMRASTLHVNAACCDEMHGLNRSPQIISIP